MSEHVEWQQMEFNIIFKLKQGGNSDIKIQQDRKMLIFGKEHVLVQTQSGKGIR